MNGESYVRELLKLLPEENPQRLSLESELNLGLALSGDDIHTKEAFPLSENTFSAMDFEDKVADLPISIVLRMDPQKIY